METYPNTEESIKEGDTFIVPTHIGHGIVVDKKFTYLGDGLYAEQPWQRRPEEQCGDQGEEGNTDNNVRRGDQEDSEGYRHQLNNTGSIY